MEEMRWEEEVLREKGVRDREGQGVRERGWGEEEGVEEEKR
jgi:hypothetical protein